jgi:NhaA family Na+:H+ antiporter
MVRFLAQETASGLLLLFATAAALIWANSPWSEGYHHFWETEIELTIGSWAPLILDGHPLNLELVVNDVLMVLFFFVVGLEIKSELVTGDLSSPKDAALPAIGALGGMIIPAGLYALINIGGEGFDGWGVPMATDIAFAVGVLALLGPRIPARLKLFLLALAIADDIGAILVIAVFYSEGLQFGWLGLAIGGLALVIVLQRVRVWFTPVYVIIGVIIWYATFRSGVHATIAGVALGLLAPARPLLGTRAFERVEDLFSGDSTSPGELRDASWKIRESVPVTGRLIGLMSPWTSFLVIPIFALANAGVTLSGDALSEAATSRVTLGVIIGLVVGKPVGIWLTTMVAVRFTSVELPPGLTSLQILGAGAVAGIGFTVALFIGSLAFEDPALGEQATMGVLVASVGATLLGFLILRRVPGPAPVPDIHDVKA